jgi:hypothetical protein
MEFVEKGDIRQISRLGMYISKLLTSTYFSADGGGEFVPIT